MSEDPVEQELETFMVRFNETVSLVEFPEHVKDYLKIVAEIGFRSGYTSGMLWHYTEFRRTFLWTNAIWFMVTIIAMFLTYALTL